MRFIILLCAFLFMSCIRNGPTSPEGITSNQVIINVSERLNKKYGLKLGAIGGAVDKEGVWKINATFSRYGKVLSMKEARIMILDCIEEFLKEANNNEEFRPYMKVYPFTLENLSVGIINYDENRVVRHFPDISIVSTRLGMIFYESFGPEVKLPYANVAKESYEEALNLSKRNNEVE